MADINIENFYRHIARVLNILYASFPSKTPLYVDDVAGIDDAVAIAVEGWIGGQLAEVIESIAVTIVAQVEEVCRAGKERERRM